MNAIAGSSPPDVMKARSIIDPQAAANAAAADLGTIRQAQVLAGDAAQMDASERYL